MKDDEHIYCSDVIPCSECGQDVCCVEHRSKGGSRRYVYVAWLILIGIVLSVLVVSSPWMQARLGDPFAIYSSGSSSSQVHLTVVDPIVSAFDFQQVSSGVDGNRSNAKLDYWVASSRDSFDWWLQNSQVRFVFAEPDGSHTHQEYRGVLGDWYSEWSTTLLKDIKAEPVGDWPYDFPIEAVDTSAYDSYLLSSKNSLLRSEQVRLQGGQLARKTINLVHISGSLAVLVLLIRLLTWLLRRVGIDALRKRKHRILVFYASYALLIGLGLLHVTEYGGVGVYGAVSVSGDWFEEDEIELLLENENGQYEYLNELITSLAQGAPAGHVLAFETDRSVSYDILSYTASVLGGYEFWGASRFDFYKDFPDGTQTQIPRPDWSPVGMNVHMNWRMGLLSASNGSTMHSRTIYMSIPLFALLGVMALAILKLLYLFGRLLEARSHRRRVSRDQCIFCAYPLSEEGVAARSLGNSS